MLRPNLRVIKKRVQRGSRRSSSSSQRGACQAYDKTMKTLLLQNQQIIMQNQNMMFMIMKQFEPRSMATTSIATVQQQVEPMTELIHHHHQQQSAQQFHHTADVHSTDANQHNKVHNLQHEQQLVATATTVQMQGHHQHQQQEQSLHSLHAATQLNHQQHNQQQQQHHNHNQQQHHQLGQPQLSFTRHHQHQTLQQTQQLNNGGNDAVQQQHSQHHDNNQQSTIDSQQHQQHLAESISAAFMTPVTSEQDPSSDLKPGDDEDINSLLANDTLLTSNLLYNPQTDIGQITPYKQQQLNHEQTPSYYSSGCESLTTPLVEQQQRARQPTLANINQAVVKNLADSFKSPSKPKINVQILSGSATRNMKNSKAKIIQRMNISEFLRHVHQDDPQVQQPLKSSATQ